MIAGIFAIDSAGGIGKNGTLPWPKDSEDLKWFKQHTMGQVVVMGRNTWEDPAMPKPLPGRINAVVTSRENLYMADDAHMIILGNFLDNSIRNLEKSLGNKTVFIIGGTQLLLGTQHLVQKIILTRFEKDYDCNVKIDIEKYLQNFDLTEEILSQGKRFQIYHAKLP